MNARVVTSEFGERTEFSMLGEKLDLLARVLSNALNKMLLRTHESIKELVPNVDPSTVHKLAALMKDGRATRRKELDQFAMAKMPSLTVLRRLFIARVIHSSPEQ